MRLLLTGGTSSIGRVLRPKLDGLRWDIEAPGRQELDLGLPVSFVEALRGVDTLVHLASSPGAPSRVDGGGTRRLIHAAAEAGVRHFVFLSIVGVDRIPVHYYEQKWAAEQEIEKVGLAHTILRSTQFHGFLDILFGQLSKVPFVFPVPKGWSVQPVDAAEVASVLVEAVEAGPRGRLPEIGGPEILILEDAVKKWMEARGKRKPMWRIRVPGEAARKFEMGLNCCDGGRRGRQSFSQYLSRH